MKYRRETPQLHIVDAKQEFSVTRMFFVHFKCAEITVPMRRLSYGTSPQLSDDKSMHTQIPALSSAELGKYETHPPPNRSVEDYKNCLSRLQHLLWVRRQTLQRGFLLRIHPKVKGDFGKGPEGGTISYNPRPAERRRNCRCQVRGVRG